LFIPDIAGHLAVAAAGRGGIAFVAAAVVMGHLLVCRPLLTVLIARFEGFAEIWRKPAPIWARMAG
jgi:hypothetical protein